jgi:hypothetical protein
VTAPTPPPVDEVLTDVLSAALESGAAVAASICARRVAQEPPRVLAATDDRARIAEDLQHAAPSAPCMSAEADGVVLVADGDLVHRFPEYGQQLVERTGLRAVLSHAIPRVDRPAVLDLYADAAFGPDDVAAAAETARVCAVAIAALAMYDRARNLDVALGTSRQISAAVGIVMAQYRCDYDDAFRRIRGISQRTHRKIRDLAEEILLTGALP